MFTIFLRQLFWKIICNLSPLANECYSFDVDFLTDSDNQCISADSAQKCQEACEDEDTCTAFTWIGNANDLDQNCCLIKSRPEGNEKTVTGFVSGPKHCGKLILRKKRHFMLFYQPVYYWQ